MFYGSLKVYLTQLQTKKYTTLNQSLLRPHVNVGYREQKPGPGKLGAYTWYYTTMKLMSVHI